MVNFSMNIGVIDVIYISTFLSALVEFEAFSGGNDDLNFSTECFGTIRFGQFHVQVCRY